MCLPNVKCVPQSNSDLCYETAICETYIKSFFHFVFVCMNILGSCSLRLRCWKVPAWVVSDGSDPQQTVLLSIFHNRKSGWVTRNIVRQLGHWGYKQAEEYAVNMKTEHLSLAKIPGCEV
jgi:hypothetical protein